MPSLASSLSLNQALIILTAPLIKLPICLMSMGTGKEKVLLTYRCRSGSFSLGSNNRLGPSGWKKWHTPVAVPAPLSTVPHQSQREELVLPMKRCVVATQ